MTPSTSGERGSIMHGVPLLPEAVVEVTNLEGGMGGSGGGGGDQQDEREWDDGDGEGAFCSGRSFG